MAACASIFPESLAFNSLLPSALDGQFCLSRGRHSTSFMLA